MKQKKVWMMDRISDIYMVCVTALMTDGEDHKQFTLEQIMSKLTGKSIEVMRAEHRYTPGSP